MPVAANDSASSGVVTTSAIGKPFPIGLPKVTMSGTTPRKMHSYDLAHSSMQACYTQGLDYMLHCFTIYRAAKQDCLQTTSLMRQDSSSPLAYCLVAPGNICLYQCSTPGRKDALAVTE